MMERRVVAVIVPVIGHRYHVDGRVENPLAVELMFHQLPEETSRLLPSGTFHNLRNRPGRAVSAPTVALATTTATEWRSQPWQSTTTAESTPGERNTGHLGEARRS